MPNYEKLYNIKGTNGTTLGSKFKKNGVVLTVAEFGAKYFSDQAGVDSLYKIIDTNRKKTTESPYAKVFSNTLEQFYKDYACDLPWATSITYCSGGGGVFNINEYIGAYKDNVTKATLDVADKDGTDLKLVAYGQSIGIIHKANDTFNLLIDFKYVTVKGVIDFKRDATNNVIGFHYKFENIPAAFKSFLPANFQPEGDATRDLSTSTTSDYFKDSDNTGKWDYFMGKSGSPFPREKKDSGTQQNTQPKQNIIKNEPYKVAMPDKIVPCDENAYNWTVGCQNNKIKQLNLRMLGKELDGVYTDELRRSLINSGYIRSTNSEITKDLYNEIMSLKLQESIVKKVVLKNLKELLNKNL
jgi:hypothetical protein